MAEEGVVAIFENHPLQMGAESELAGRPIFKDVEHIRILIPGDNKTEVFRIATDNDKARFAEQYALFRKGIEGDGQIVGTPLSQWSVLTPADVKGFEAIGIRTVEHLAEMSDHVKQKVGMGANEYQAKARAYLEQAKDSAAVTRMAAENERYKADIDELRRQVAELAALAEAPEKRGPGRPPKAAA